MEPKIVQITKSPESYFVAKFKQSDRKVTITVAYVADYFASESIRFPFAYVLSVAEPDVIDNLKTHGIELERLTEETTFKNGVKVAD